MELCNRILTGLHPSQPFLLLILLHPRSKPGSYLIQPSQEPPHQAPLTLEDGMLDCLASPLPFSTVRSSTTFQTSVSCSLAPTSQSVYTDSMHIPIFLSLSNFCLSGTPSSRPAKIQALCKTSLKACLSTNHSHSSGDSTSSSELLRKLLLDTLGPPQA